MSTTPTISQGQRELWADRPKETRVRGLGHENAVQFCRRVYGQLISAGQLTDERLHEHDPGLLKAVRQWAQRHPDDTVPALTLRLPTLQERIARLGPETDREEIIRLGHALNKEKRRPQ